MNRQDLVIAVNNQNRMKLKQLIAGGIDISIAIYGCARIENDTVTLYLMMKTM